MPLQLWLVNTDQYKNDIATRIGTPIGRSSWMLNADCSREFAEHITSEHRIVDDKGRDCCVYAFAVADLVNMRALQERIIEEPADTAAEDEELAIPEPGFTI